MPSKVTEIHPQGICHSFNSQSNLLQAIYKDILKKEECLTTIGIYRKNSRIRRVIQDYPLMIANIQEKFTTLHLKCDRVFQENTQAHCTFKTLKNGVVSFG